MDFGHLPSQYVAEENAGDWPSPQKEYHRQVHLWTEAAFEEARYESSQSPEVQRLSKDIDFICGKQWPSGRPQYRSKPVESQLQRLFFELVGLLTDIRPIAKVSVTGGKSGDELRTNLRRQAEIYSNIIYSWWNYGNVDLSLGFTIMHALLSTGYGKLEWNKSLRNGQGDLDLVPLGPNNVLPLKMLPTGIQTSKCVIYQKVMTLQEIRELHPLRGSAVKPDPEYSRFEGSGRGSSASMSPLTYRGLSPQMQRVMGQGTLGPASSVYPQALYREFWFDDPQRNESDGQVWMGDRNSNWAYVVNPKAKLYPRGRLIVKGGDVVLYDGPNPWWHGKKPFASLRLNIVPWSVNGLSEMAPLIPQQEIKNNVLAGILDMVKKAVNPAMIAPKNAFSEEAWKQLDFSMPGAKGGYSMLTRDKPSFLPAPTLPGFVMQVYTLMNQAQASSSGMSMFQAALQKKQVPGGDTFDQIRNAQNTPMRLKGRWIELYLREIGQLALPSIPQMYSAGRRIQMGGLEWLTAEDFDFDPGSMVPDGMRPEDHLRNFEFAIQPDSALRLNRMEELAILAQLRKGRDIDRRTVLERVGMGLDPDVIEQRLLVEAQQPPGLQPPQKQHGGREAKAI